MVSTLQDSQPDPRNHRRHLQTRCLTCLDRRDDMSHIAALDVPRTCLLARDIDHRALGNCPPGQGTGFGLDLDTLGLDPGTLGTSRSNWACLAPPAEWFVRPSSVEKEPLVVWAPPPPRSVRPGAKRDF